MSTKLKYLQIRYYFEVLNYEIFDSLKMVHVIKSFSSLSSLLFLILIKWIIEMYFAIILLVTEVDTHTKKWLHI